MAWPRGGRDRVLLQAEVGQRRAARDAQLRLDQVDAGHLLGDGVLDLQAWVGLDEGEVALVPLIDQKLEGAQAQVVDGGGHAHGRGGDPIARRVAQPGAGRQLDDLLVAALQAALALAQVRDAALAVADDLHLDVPRPRDQPLHEDGVVAEGGARLGLGARVGLLDLAGVRHDAHAPAAAAGDRLDHHRRLDVRVLAEGVEERARLVEADGVGAAGQDRHVVADGQVARLRLVAEQLQRPHRRPHEGDALLGAAARERRVLGQEAVARMHGVAAGRLGRFDHRLDVEVAARAGARQRLRLVRPAHVQRRRVVGRMHRHRHDLQLPRGAHHPDRDLAAVRDEQFLNRHHILLLLGENIPATRPAHPPRPRLNATSGPSWPARSLAATRDPINESAAAPDPVSRSCRLAPVPSAVMSPPMTGPVLRPRRPSVAPRSAAGFRLGRLGARSRPPARSRARCRRRRTAP